MRSEFLVAILLIYHTLAFGLEDVAILPKGVRAIMIRQGFVTEIGNKYSSNYQLGSLDFRTSRRIDSQMIQAINPEFKELVEIMNEEFPAYNLGDRIYLGDLVIDGAPKVSYQAPVIVYGVSNRYMIGLAVPFVHFSANISARQEGGNNIAEIKSSMPTSYQSGQGSTQNFSDRLDDAYLQLQDASNLTAKLQSICSEKNLQCVGNYNEDSLGDMMIIQRYLLHKGPKWSFLARTYINLPTGPKDDPNSLIDIPIFHRSFLDNAIVGEYSKGRWKFNNALGFVYQVPDKIDKRVPRYDGDVLPDEERLETVSRKIGDTLKYEFNFQYQMMDELAMGFGFQKEWKRKDQYSGERDYEYKLLAKDSDAEVLKMQTSVSFSTVQWFMAKKFPIPMAFTYLYSDIVSGKNVERQSLHELNLTVMF